MRLDRREPLLAQLARLREQRLDADPSDWDQLTDQIDALPDRLQAVNGG